jgi:hypothetical protein
MSESLQDALQRLRSSVEKNVAAENIKHHTDPGTGFTAVLDKRYSEPVLQVTDPATHNTSEFRITADGLVPTNIFDVDGKQLLPTEIGREQYQTIIKKNSLIAKEPHDAMEE